jgi:hypothetical protein
VHKAPQKSWSLDAIDDQNSTYMKTMEPSHLYPVGGWVGKNCHQIARKRDDKKRERISLNDCEIYDKWAQAIASSNDLLYNSVEEGETSNKDRLLSFILPVLVVSDDCLWSVDHDKDGKRKGEPIQINEVDFYINNTISYLSVPTWHVYAISHIKIITFIGLEVLAERIADKDSIWDEIFDESNLHAVDESDADDEKDDDR